MIKVRLILAIVKHLCNNESYSTERWERHSALMGITHITRADVNLHTGNVTKTIQPSSSIWGVYLGYSLVGKPKASG